MPFGCGHGFNTVGSVDVRTFFEDKNFLWKKIFTIFNLGLCSLKINHHKSIVFGSFRYGN